MQDITNSGTPTNFSLPTGTEKQTVHIPPAVAASAPAPSADQPYVVHTEQEKIRDTAQFNAPKVGSTGSAGAPTVSAPSLDSFSPELDINSITNSGTPGATTAIEQPGSSSLHGSDAPVSPVGPPAEDQSPASEHVDGLSRGLAGIVLTAPLLAAEKLGQTSLAETARSYLPTGAGGTNTSSAAEQVNSAGQVVYEQAPILANQAAAGATTLASQAAMLAQQAYASAQANFHATQPNPADSLHELAEGVDTTGHSTAVAPKEVHSTAVTAAEPAPFLPIDGAVLLPSAGTPDPAVEGIDTNAPEEARSHEGPTGQTIAAHHDGLPDSAPTFLAALPNKDLPDEANTESAGAKALAHDKHKSSAPAFAAAGAGAAVGGAAAYELAPKDQGQDQASAAKELVHGEQEGTTARSESPQFGAASQPAHTEHPVIPVPDEGSSRLKGDQQQQGTPIDKVDVAPITDKAKDLNMNQSSTPAAGDKIESVPVAPIEGGDSKTEQAKDKVASAVDGGHKGETRREHIDTSPPDDHDHASPMFMESDKVGLGSKIKGLFHKN